MPKISAHNCTNGTAVKSRGFTLKRGRSEQGDGKLGSATGEVFERRLKRDVQQVPNIARPSNPDADPGSDSRCGRSRSMPHSSDCLAYPAEACACSLTDKLRRMDPVVELTPVDFQASTKGCAAVPCGVHIGAVCCDFYKLRSRSHLVASATSSCCDGYELRSHHVLPPSSSRCCHVEPCPAHTRTFASPSPRKQRGELHQEAVLTHSKSSAERPNLHHRPATVRKLLAVNGDIKRELRPDGRASVLLPVPSRRQSLRRVECAFRYKEVVVKQCAGYMHVILNTASRHGMKNSLNPSVMQELKEVLVVAANDDFSHLVVLSGACKTFCTGIDVGYLTEAVDRAAAARLMADAIGSLVEAMASFPKPLVAAVEGFAAGAGVGLLTLCDVVYASDKAAFFTPYARLKQTPEAALSHMLPLVLGTALANDMLLFDRQLTALEACQAGLVSQVFWPTTTMQEVASRASRAAALGCGAALRATKRLVCINQGGVAAVSQLRMACSSERAALLDLWPRSDWQAAATAYLCQHAEGSTL